MLCLGTHCERRLRLLKLGKTTNWTDPDKAPFASSRSLANIAFPFRSLGTRTRIIMANSFDPYREALVVEQSTVWPDSLAQAPAPADREHIEKLLHQEPSQAIELEYVRLATGFQRKITVTAEDVERLKTK